MANALEILEKAMSLPLADRSFIAERLLESLDAGHELSPEWRAEIASRVLRREAGETRVFARDEIRRDVQALCVGS